MIQFTQGDSVTITLTATDGNGNPINLTGATFSTQIKGPNGVIATFVNSKHTANPDQVNFTGYFTLSLLTTDSMLCGLGSNKDIMTYVTIGSASVYYKGNAILTVNPAVPLQ